MASVNCAVRGCHNSWRKRNLTLSQLCYEHQKKRSECCGPAFTLHRPPVKEKDRRAWLKALNLKNPPKFPFVCSYHFVDGKPTPEHPYPEKWLDYVAPLKRPRRVLVRHTSKLTWWRSCLTRLSAWSCSCMFSVIDIIYWAIRTFNKDHVMFFNLLKYVK